VFALAAVGFAGNGVSVALQDTAKSDLLLLFFASLGLSSDLRQLARSSARPLRFLRVLIPFLVVQDAMRAAMVRLLGCTRSSASSPARPRMPGSARQANRARQNTIAQGRARARQHRDAVGQD
jgi:hypothetical protein